MTTREFIAALQAADPSGDLPVFVNGENPYLVECEPAYYDGRQCLLIEDPAKKPYWSIVGARMVYSFEDEGSRDV